MRSAIEIMQNMLAPYQQDLDGLLQPQADYGKVDYLPQKDKERGTYDGNFTNRFRILTAIQFRPGKPCPACETLTRRLLMEEIKDRESNSFQGVGNLELIVWLLKNDVQESDIALFTRAKNANFDTACGFHPDEILEDDDFTDDLANLDLEEYIDLTLALQEFSHARELIDLWQQEQTEWDEKTLSILRYWHSRRKDLLGELETLEKISALSLASGDSKQICSDLQSLARKQIELGLMAEARQTLLQVQNDLPRVPRWETIGLGRFIIEDCMDVIIHLSDKDQQSALWAWASPYLSTMENKHGNLCQKGAAAATLMGDPGLAERMTAIWEEMMRPLQKK